MPKFEAKYMEKSIRRPPTSKRKIAQFCSIQALCMPITAAQIFHAEVERKRPSWQAFRHSLGVYVSNTAVRLSAMIGCFVFTIWPFVIFLFPCEPPPSFPVRSRQATNRLRACVCIFTPVLRCGVSAAPREQAAVSPEPFLLERAAPALQVRTLSSWCATRGHSKLNIIGPVELPHGVLFSAVGNLFSGGRINVVKLASLNPGCLRTRWVMESDEQTRSAAGCVVSCFLSLVRPPQRSLRSVCQCVLPRFSVGSTIIRATFLLAYAFKRCS